jgi:outer membrane protein
MYSTLVFCDESLQSEGTKDVYTEQKWGLGFSFRSGSIPYATNDKIVNDFVPMLFFENDYFFLNGLESGFKLYNTQQWRFSALTRAHYTDIPQEYQNQLQTNSTDVGFQIRYKLQKNKFLDFEIMDDLHGRYFSNIKYSEDFERSSFEYSPYVQLRWNSSKFNSYYYGLNQTSIAADISTAVGIEGKYHLVSNLYLLAKAEAKYLGKEVRQSRYIEENLKTEVYLGFGFFNDRTKEKKEELSMSPYLRLAYGWATPSNLGDLLVGGREKDPYNNQMTSLFYGYPLTDTLFSLPLELYLTPGFVFHHSSEVQDSTQEFIIAIKAYYTIPLPWRVRFGVAEGFSYINNITYIEETEMEEKGYKPSHLLNYLDFSLDVHLGDIFGKNLNRLWLGYSIHHRSAIFETSSRFGRIKGGSNYTSVYLQFHY